MKQSYGICLFFAVMVGGIAATHALTTEPLPDGMTCQSERVAVFGWTDPRRAMAELAAITKWQQEAEKQRPGWGKWHLARKRSLSCREFKASAHFQCVISGTPCTLKGG